MREIIKQQYEYLTKLARAYVEQKKCAKTEADVNYWDGKLAGIVQGINALELILNNMD